MKKLLIFLFFISLVYKANSQIFHIIEVVDVEELENSMVISKSIVQDTIIFSTIAKAINYKVNNRFFIRKYFNTNTLRDTLNSMKIGPKDFVAFHYSGKANYEAKSVSNFPNLLMAKSNSDPLNIDEIGKILLNRGAKLNLVIVDCVGKRQELEIPVFVPQRPTRIVSKKSKEIIKNLMNTSCGLIKVASQTAKNESFIIKPIRLRRSETSGDMEYWKDPNEQSVFAMSFYEVFEDILKTPNEMVTWTDLFRNVQYRVNEELNPTATTNRSQQLAFEYTSCKTNEAIVTNSLTISPQKISVLEAKLDQLIDIKNTKKRAEYIENIKKTFDPKNTITYSVYLDRKVKVNPIPVKKIAYFITLGDYLKTLAEYNPKIMGIKVVDRKNDNDTILAGTDIVLEEFYIELK